MIKIQQTAGFNSHGLTSINVIIVFPCKHNVFNSIKITTIHFYDD